MYLEQSGLISFSVISYLSSLIIMTMIGFSQGIQPMVSYHYGKKEKQYLAHIFSICLSSMSVLGFFFIILSYCFSQNFVGYFLHELQELETTAFAFRIYALSYLFLGWNILFSSFFTAMKKTKYSLMITVCRGLFFPIFSLVLIKSLFGKEQLWFAALLSEASTSLVSYQLYRKAKGSWKEKKSH